MATSSSTRVPDMTGKVVVVTGGNRGIGFAAAEAIAAAGARVTLACRDAADAERAARTVRRRHPGARVDTVDLDLSSLSSVRECARTLHERTPRIDVLCNNAGVMLPPRRRLTEDGFELQFGVNHLGHFALTALLRDTLTDGRVVSVSSMGHRMSKGLDFADLQYAKRYRAMAAYCDSKLANLLFCFELNRRTTSADGSLIAVACHPGMTKSNLLFASHRAAGQEPPLALRFADLVSQPTTTGAEPLTRAATDATVSAGDYFGPSRWFETRGHPTTVRPASSARDENAAARLWTMSEKLAEVSF